MEEANQTSYFWKIVTLFIAISLLGMWADLVYLQKGFVIEAIFREEMRNTLITAIIMFGMAASLAKSSFRKRDYFALAIFSIVILIGIILYSGGGFEAIAGMIAFAAAVAFMSMYGFFRLVLRRSSSFAKWIIRAQSLIIIGIILTTLAYASSGVISWKNLGNNAISDQDAVLNCEEIALMNPAPASCWKRLIKDRKPDTNICLYAKTTQGYSKCFYQGIFEVYSNKDGSRHDNWWEVCKDIASMTKERYGIRDTYRSPPGEFRFDARSVMLMVDTCQYRI